MVRLSGDLADVDEVELAAGRARRGVDADFFTVGAEAGVGVAAPFAGVLFWRIETAEREEAACGDFEEVGILVAVFVGVGIVEDPTVAGEEGAMAVLGHGIFADNGDFAGVGVFEEVEAFAVGRLIREGEDVLGVAPDEVRGEAVGVNDAEIRAIGVGSDHAGFSSAGGSGPAVEEDESRAIGIVEEMVEPVVFRSLHAGELRAGLGDLDDGEEDFLRAVFEIDVEEACVIGEGDFEVGIGDAVVAVAGAGVAEAAEVGGDGVPAVGTEGVDGMGDGAE